MHVLVYLRLKKMNFLSTVGLGNIILLVNAFVWYSCVYAVLNKIIEIVAFTTYEKLMLYTINFCGATFSILLGAFVVSWCNVRRSLFLLCWTISGAIFSMIFIFPGIMTVVNMIIISLLLSISFGFGLAAAMDSFAKNTALENRARSGSIVLLSIFFSMIILRSALTDDFFLNSLILMLWRALGLTAFVFLDIKEEDVGLRTKSHFKSILKERSLVLYLIPWAIFSLVNYLSWDVNANVYGEELIQISALIENIIAGVSAIVAGLISDIKGRKIVTLIAFILFGFGYAVLGIYPLNIFAWYFYVVIDGTAWGIISVIFLFTIWGDLAHGKSSEKYYAIGILPYSLSIFMRLTIGSFIAERISHYAIFSFAALFLFFAVVPLMFAPETLPEKTLKERELRSYIEKAKRVREKFTKD